MAIGRKTGGGSRKGIPNRTTVVAKQAFQDAFDQIGGVQRLVTWAKANPDDFFKLYARLIPVEQTGPNGGAQEFNHTVTWLTSSSPTPQGLSFSRTTTEKPDGR